MAKKIENEAEVLVEATKQSAAEWIEKNAKVIMIALAALLVIICGFFAVKKFIVEPKAIEAGDAIAKAVVYFDQNAYETALNGDEADCEGFAALADKYSNQEGKLAALYAGLCEYELGNYEKAAKYLSDFSADDVNVAPAAKVRLGDAYVELGELDKAIKAFKAAADSKNELIAPIALKKAAIVYMEKEDKASAKKLFEQIKSDFPLSTEAQDVDKFINLVD
ncbi:MAG: tetratricopeptide repeat protein [Paludibacteraceae bacterium]|nr:tetratricopeptide repeat protein [Paludibacteraceae bacterium]